MLLLVCAALWVPVAWAWHAERLHYVDHFTTSSIVTNFLFRGSAPIINGSFAFGTLRDTLTKAASAEANLTVPPMFDLVVITMLNDLKGSEATELRAEKAYFAAINSSSGPGPGSQLVHWPIIGDVVSPHAYDDTKDICLGKAKSYDERGDHMVTKTELLRGYLIENRPLPVPVVVYFHCDAGMDRTGEMYGDYSMRYKNQTYSQVYDYDNSIEGPGGRQINTVNKQALEWMCLYLQTSVPTTRPQCNACQ